MVTKRPFEAVDDPAIPAYWFRLYLVGCIEAAGTMPDHFDGDALDLVLATFRHEANRTQTSQQQGIGLRLRHNAGRWDQSIACAAADEKCLQAACRVAGARR